VERWAIKTLTDTDAPRVDFVNITHTTIAALNALAAHCGNLPSTRGFDQEFHVYEVEGVALVARDESDHDVHVALADPDESTQTIVVEVVDPACATASPFLTMLSNARSDYQRLGVHPGQRVNVRGVGFFDVAHGQTGRSQSCIELHPVLDISAR
jgi:hypothetical protein